IEVDRVDELDEPQGRQLAQLLQIRLLERLDDDWGVPMDPSGSGENGNQALLDREADGLVVGRMLDLGVNSDGTALLFGLTRGARDHLLERRDLELAVELLRTLGK